MDEQFFVDDDEIILVVKPRYDGEIEVKIKSITTQDDSFSIEFASREDWNLFIDNYQNVPVRLVFV